MMDTRRNASLLVLTLAFAGGCREGEAATGAGSSVVPPHRSGCVLATLEHKNHTDDPDGIAHDVYFRERFIRCKDRTWTERVLPRGLPAENHAHGHGHKDLPPLHEVGRLVTLGADGKATLALVWEQEKQIIEMEPASYDAMRFNGDWDTAQHLIPWKTVSKMEPMRRNAPAGSEWREKSSANGVLRVLWSTTYDLPLEIDSVSADLARRDTIRVTVEPIPPSFKLPWEGTSGYTKKVDSDFGD